MAVVTAPLLSFGARGQLGKAIVHFGWKGLSVVRTYVVPANPQTSGQTTQRGHLTDAVALVHDAQAQGANSFGAADVTAYALLASVFKAAQTWFNEVCRQFVTQRVASLFGVVYRNGAVEVAAGQLTLTLNWSKDADSANNVTAGNVWYGTSKTSMVTSLAATVAAGVITRTITGLTAGTKYYMQFRATEHADFLGTRSGIYTGDTTIGLKGRIIFEAPVVSRVSRPR